jgi:PGF-pre-PGF domain-containing protein
MFCEKLKKACLAIISVLCLSLICLQAIAAQQNDMSTGGDAGDNFTEAATISISETGTGYVDASDTVDYYTFTVAKDYLITAEITPSSHFTVSLWSDNENEVASGTSSASATAIGWLYYYVSVERYSGTQTDYALTITSNETIANIENENVSLNDMGTGGDASDDATYATTISAGSGTGYLHEYVSATSYQDVYDYYKINVSSGQTITASLTPPAGATFELQILDNSLSGTYKVVAGGQTDSLSTTATYSGDYYVEVSRVSGSGYYSLTVSVSGSTDTTDMGTGADAGSGYDTAATISAGTGTGYMNGSDTTDVYKISVTSGQTLSVTLTPASGSDFNLILYDNTTTLDYSSLGVGHADSVDSTAALSGYLYIWVTYVSGSGNYTLTTTISENASTTQENVTATSTTTTATAAVSNISTQVGQTISVGENGVASVTVQSATAVVVNFETAQPVKSITVSTDAAVENISVQAQQLSAKPSAVPEPTSVKPGILVSHYLDITVSPTATTSVSVENAVIEFKVLKSWLTDNNIDPATVSLMEYDTSWTELTTTATSEDATYKYYSATTSGFSTFAVVGRAIVTDSTMIVLAAGVAAVVIVAAAVVALTRKKKPT